MAILSNLIVNGSARILNKLYVKDLAVAGSATFEGISAKTVSASSSLTSSGTLTVAGSTTFNGNVSIAAGKTLHLQNTTDAAGATDNATALIIGPRSGVHLSFDNNEIMAKANGTTASTLGLNSDGGIVNLSNGGLVSVNNGTITSTTIANRGIISTEHMNVANTLRATRFDLQTISQSGGSLYISPTIKLPNANTTVVVAKSGSTLTLTITDPSITSTTMAGAVWSVNSLVKASGEFNGVASGTMDGKVTGLNTSSHVLTVQVSGENSGAVAAATYNQSTVKNLSVMLYQRYVDANTSYRVGLWLSCYDIVNNSVAIRVYGGTAVNPNAYLGNMTGASLPAVNGTTPSGWGLYADNAFLSGVIVSNAGKIGGWTLSSSSLSNGTYGSDNSTFISTVNMANHAIAGRTAADWRITAGSHFGITNTGALYCNSATITGSITANSGKIGNFVISSSAKDDTTANGGHVYDVSLYTHSGDGTYEYESGMKGDSNSATAESGNLLFYTYRMAKGGKWASGSKTQMFYVNKSGYLYAANADIAGKITAKSGTIGGCAIESGVLKVANANITGLDASKINAGTINAARIGANTITATKLALSDPTNYIQVNESNSASAVTENHPFGGGGNDVVSGGYFSKTTATNTYLALSCYMQNSFLENDELYYSISIKGASAGTCKVGIWFYGTNGNTNDKSNVTSILGDSISFTTADKPYVGSIKINATAAAAGYYAIGIQDTTATKVQLYCKNASMRKKNGATLIVDGAISTNKLEANAVTAAKIAANTITASQIASGAITTDELAANAVTSAKIKAGAVTADKLEASSIIISGRNLLVGTRNAVSATIDTKTSNPTNNYQTISTYYTWGKNTIAVVGGGAKADDYATISFDWSTSEQTTYGTFRIELYGEKDSSNTDTYIAAFGSIPIVTTSASLKSGHVVVTAKLTPATIKTKRIIIRFDNCKFKITISNMMFSLSNREVDWSPSPYELGGFQIDANSIHTANVAVTSNANNSIALSNADFTRTVAGASRTGLRFAIGSNFGVTNTGALYASSGTIGGWSITSNTIYKDISGYRAGLYADSNVTTGSGAFFIATKDSSNKITGYPFLVTYGGKLTATNADIKGKITSSEGTIGGFTLSGSNLHNGMTNLSDTKNNGVYIGTDGIALGAGKFKVTKEGAVTATSLTIKMDQVEDLNTSVNRAQKTATNYLTATTDGIKIHPLNDTKNYSLIDTNGLKIYKNSKLVASYGDSVVIGNGSYYTITVGQNNIQFRDNTSGKKSYSVIGPESFVLYDLSRTSLTVSNAYESACQLSLNGLYSSGYIKRKALVKGSSYNTFRECLINDSLTMNYARSTSTTSSVEHLELTKFTINPLSGIIELTGCKYNGANSTVFTLNHNSTNTYGGTGASYSDIKMYTNTNWAVLEAHFRNPSDSNETQARHATLVSSDGHYIYLGGYSNDIHNIIIPDDSFGGFSVSAFAKNDTTSKGGHLFDKTMYVQSYDGDTLDNSTYEYESGLKGTDLKSSTALFYVRRMPKGKVWNTTNAENVFYIRKDGRITAHVQCDFDLLKIGQIKSVANIASASNTKYLCLGTADKKNGGGDYLYYAAPWTGSSIRYKNVERELTSADVNAFYNVKPVWASYKDDYLGEGHYWLGVNMPMLIAEDIEKIFPKAVKYDNGKVDNYDDHLVVSVHQQMLIDQKVKIEKLESRIAYLEDKLKELKTK